MTVIVEVACDAGDTGSTGSPILGSAVTCVSPGLLGELTVDVS